MESIFFFFFFFFLLKPVPQFGLLEVPNILMAWRWYFYVKIIQHISKCTSYVPNFQGGYNLKVLTEEKLHLIVILTYLFIFRIESAIQNVEGGGGGGMGIQGLLKNFLFCMLFFLSIGIFQSIVTFWLLGNFRY